MSLEIEWRDFELQASDWIVLLPDHPQKEAYITYRQALRDYPATDNFATLTRPELGS